MADYRLPDLLVTNRSGVGLMVSLFCASLCSFGALRACELQEEEMQEGPVPMLGPPSNGVCAAGAVPDAETGQVPQ